MDKRREIEIGTIEDPAFVATTHMAVKHYFNDGSDLVYKINPVLKLSGEEWIITNIDMQAGVFSYKDRYKALSQMLYFLNLSERYSIGDTMYWAAEEPMAKVTLDPLSNMYLIHIYRRKMGCKVSPKVFIYENEYVTEGIVQCEGKEEKALFTLRRANICRDGYKIGNNVQMKPRILI